MEDKKITTVTLHRGQNGLGFNIRGGLDQPHLPNDFGIFVTKIRQNGAAALDGTIQEGDMILEINGNTMENINHNDAVNLFLSAGEGVALKIWSGAERILMDRYSKSLEEKGSAKRRNIALIVAGAALLLCVVYFRRDIMDGLKKLAAKMGHESSQSSDILMKPESSV